MLPGEVVDGYRFGVNNSDSRWETGRTRLAEILAPGMAEDPLEHARQVAEVAAVLEAAFSAAGFVVTVVGGSAIEVHAPGIYRSGDIDLVLRRLHSSQATQDQIFRGLGFRKEGRHWRHEDTLFVELVTGPVAGPEEVVRVGEAQFRVVKKEVVLRDRIVGFKHRKYTAYGEQAIDMLAAFGHELDESWLIPELEREDAVDALEALKRLAGSSEPVTDEILRDLVRQLYRRSSA